MKRTNQAPFFPDDIIFEILTRLPGKSLARFKCVCKSCHFLINQLKYDNDHRVILSSDYTFQSVDFEASRIKAVQLDFPLKVDGHVDVLGFNVIGSCNGLLLVNYYKGFVIWNPWTGGHKRLSDYIGAYSYDYFGFGYDHSTDDYKIVRICRISGSDNKHQVEIYSLKTKSCQKKITLDWRIRSIIGSGSWNLVNGALYWLIYYVVGLELGTFRIQDDYISLAVLRFDLSNQEYSVILSPEEVASVPTFNNDASVGVFGGRLCMVGYIRENHHMCMWAMEDQNQNWIKLMSIPPLVETDTNIFLIPVCLMNNGELLLKIGHRRFIDRSSRRYIGEFFLYNPEEKTFKELEIQDIDENFSGHTTYTQTLVSPLIKY